MPKKYLPKASQAWLFPLVFRCQSETLRDLELADGDTVVVVPPRVWRLRVVRSQVAICW